MAASPLPSQGSPMPSKGRTSEMAHKWAQCLHHPCLLGAPQCLGMGENQKWPTSGQNGYITLAFSGVPNAHQGEEIRNCPQVSTVATFPLPSRGSPTPSKGRNQKWPTSGDSGYMTPAFSGIPNAEHRGKIRKVPYVGRVATSPLPSRGSPMPSKGRK